MIRPKRQILCLSYHLPTQPQVVNPHQFYCHNLLKGAHHSVSVHSYVMPCVTIKEHVWTGALPFILYQAGNKHYTTSGTFEPGKSHFGEHQLHCQGSQ